MKAMAVVAQISQWKGVEKGILFSSYFLVFINTALVRNKESYFDIEMPFLSNEVTKHLLKVYFNFFNCTINNIISTEKLSAFRIRERKNLRADATFPRVFLQHSRDFCSRGGAYVTRARKEIYCR